MPEMELHSSSEEEEVEESDAPEEQDLDTDEEVSWNATVNLYFQDFVNSKSWMCLFLKYVRPRDLHISIDF